MLTNPLIFGTSTGAFLEVAFAKMKKLVKFDIDRYYFYFYLLRINPIQFDIRLSFFDNTKDE